MDHRAPEETLKQPAGSQPPQLPPELPTKTARPGILKSPPSLFQPQKEPSTKTLRFKMDQPVQSQPAALLAPPTPTLETPASEAGAQPAIPSQGKLEENRDVHEKVEISSTMSESIQESLSESSTSSTSSSPFQSSVSLDSPERLVPPQKKRAASAPAAGVVITPTTQMVRRLGGRRMALHGWFPDGITRLMAGRNDRDKSGNGTPHRRAQESGDTEQDDESSPSPLFEDVPWRSSLPLQTLMGLLGGLALVFVISLMLRESRRNGGGNIESRQLEEAVTIGAEDPDEHQKSMPLPQITLSDIKEPPQASVGPGKATACSGGDTHCFALHDETPAESTELSATSATPVQPTISSGQQEVFGKVRQMRSDTLHAPRRAKVSLAKRFVYIMR
ncbi:hypothetical protein V5799_007354 [Amblyomma americanum]|uniref:Uncharacterized protein n=1 Tax=Amblyomma americanum TaxID=6943 RepID=A0AAQ4DTS4_AMBAM